MWLGGGLLVALALLLGPVFCGWLCSLGLLLELGNRLRVGFRDVTNDSVC